MATTENEKEQKAKSLLPGDYFGEISLVYPINSKTCFLNSHNLLTY